MYIKSILTIAAAILILSSCTGRRSDLEKGLQDMDRGDYRAAIQFFTASIENGEDLHTAYNNRGLSHLYLGNVEQSVEDFTKALEIEDEAVIYYNRALALIELERLEEAAGDLLNAGRLNSTDIELLTGTANAMAEAGMFDEAENLFTRVITLDPLNMDAFNGRGNVRMLAGNEKGAEEDWSRAVEIVRGR